MECPHKNLPTLIPTMHKVLMHYIQRLVKADKRTLSILWIIEHKAHCRHAKMTNIYHHVRPKIGVRLLALYSQMTIEQEHASIASSLIIQEHLRMTSVREVAAIQEPVATEIMHLLIVVHLQLAIEIHQACLADRTIIEEDTILLGIHKTTNINFPITMPQTIPLLMSNTKILIEIDNLDISCTTCLFPILRCITTQVTPTGR